MASDNKVEVKCAICQPYCDWLRETGDRDKVMSRIPGILQGCQQIYKHSISKFHKSAIDWWQCNKVDKPKEIQNILSETKITNYVKISPSTKSACLFLWDKKIVSQYKNDKLIRRYKPKTLYTIKRLWELCEKMEDHQDCSDYEKWKFLHDKEFKDLCKECKTTGRSVYVPGNTTVVLDKKSVLIGGGIKSLDPPCLGRASPYSNHPYTCKSCWLQKRDLKGLLRKRKKPKLNPSRSRLGAPGFRISYASKDEIEANVEKLSQENSKLKKENKSLRNFCLNKRSWEETLHEACNTYNDEKLVIDLLSIQNESKSIQFQVLKNLIGKMKSKGNHRYTSLILDISGLHLRRLGQTNYSLLQNLIGLCGKTTAKAHSSHERLEIGLNKKVIEAASELYDNGPVIECSDEARSLRYISPHKFSGKVELIGECWDPDIDKWDTCRKPLPRKSDRFKDDFSALNNYIVSVTSRNELAKSTALHNFAALSGTKNIPLIYIVWPTPNKGYKSQHLMKIWDKIRYNCYFNENDILRRQPVQLMGHATDSAAFQLAAACSLMTPNKTMLENNTLYLTLGISESSYSAPYLGYLPSIAYLDYDHEMRLLLKCLKYPTLDLTIWPGQTIVSISHLQELQKICLKDNLPFSENDLLFARYLDQNCDAALRIMNSDVADLLDKYVVGSSGTSLYIRAVASLMSPFLKPCSNPGIMQEAASQGITIIRLWRKVVELKKELRMNSGKNASENPRKRGHFITAGSSKTAEILFAAATDHMLAMFAHFKNLGLENSSPSKSGTKTTERIISELQGKTTQIQSLDAQPTVGDIIDRVSSVQSNQLAEDRLLEAGARKQCSTNRRRMSHARKNINLDDYVYPEKYSVFLQQQRQAYKKGIENGKKLFEVQCVAATSFLKVKGQWDFLEKSESIVPAQNQFDGSLPLGYAVDKLKNMKSHELLAGISDKVENELEEDFLLREELGFEQSEVINCKNSFDSDNEDDQSNKKMDWCVSRLVDNLETFLHVRKAIKILLPREYVSRERSRRHIAANYLPGLQPIDVTHNVHKYRFYILKLSSGYFVGKICFLEGNGKPLFSCKSDTGDATFRALLLVEIEDYRFEFSQPLKLTTWLKTERIYSEIHLKNTGENVYLLEEDSQVIFREAERKSLEYDDYKLAQQIASNDIPLEYVEIKDIINRKVDPKSHGFLYEVIFKNDDSTTWIPGHNFLEPVKYQRRKTEGNLTKKPQFATKLVEGEVLGKINENRKRKGSFDTCIAKPKLKKSSINALQKFHREPPINKITNLRPDDLNEILNGLWLGDKHIHAAGHIFTKQYPNMAMQIDIHRCTKAVVSACDGVLQIHHDDVNHWILSSNLSGEILIYDSIYSKQHNENIKEVLRDFYKNYIKDDTLNVKYAFVQKQDGNSDCGLFAIAFAVDLVEGRDPCDIVYDQTKMREHLVNCFKEGKLLSFPRL